MVQAQAHMCVEVSWEVCNKVGGIYTVVKSKVQRMQEHYRDYLLVGPYFEDKVKVECQQKVPPRELKEIFDVLEREGIRCFYGKWFTQGEPNVVLIDFSRIFGKKDELKGKLYEWYGIDSISAHWDFEEPMLFSYAVARLVEEIAVKMNPRMVAHYHEWMTGIAGLFLKKMQSGVPFIFTTHATMLGRTLCGNGVDLYNAMKHINPTEEAYRYNVQDKFLTEKACAHAADCFTTVSEMTSIEAGYLLGKKAEVLVLNGLDMETYPQWDELAIKHQKQRDRLRNFCASYFYPYYRFDMEQTLFYFITGRYEFHNKGIDMTIKALGKLNERMKAEGSKKTIVTFFWVPAGVHGIRTEILQNNDEYQKIVELVNRNMGQIKSKVIFNLMHDQQINDCSIFSEDFMSDAHRLMVKFAEQGTPALSTHHLYNEDDDPTIKGFREAGLLNREEDKVKVIFYPVYLDGADHLADLKYADAVSACHLGLFPSYYEPWGYTPLESVAFGIPAVTTDLAGFGRFMEAESDYQNGGLFLLKRYNRDEEKVLADYVDVLYKHTRLKKKDRVRHNLLARDLAGLADWKELITNYIDAHNTALSRK